MKLQSKKILISLASVLTIALGSLGGVMIYGSTSDDAKGFTIEQDESRKFAFDSFDAVMIDNNGVQDKIIGNYDRSSDSVGGVKVKEFIKRYKQNHSNRSPLFKIKTKLFNFDNRYLAAVSPKDWYDFVVWYVGVTIKNLDGTTKNIPGHLSFGPEAGSVSTFEIVPGIEKKGAGITLGGRNVKAKELSTITFYPDAFFGGMKLYSIYDGEKNNRLLTTSNNVNSSSFPSESMSLSEVKSYIEAINAINKHNRKNENEIAQSPHNRPWSPELISQYGDTIGKAFGDKWGTHSIHEFKPYYLEKESIRVNSDGSEEQLYTIYSEFIPWIEDDTPDNRDDNPSLIEKVTKEFPELATYIEDAPHIIRNPDGSFKLEESGSFNIILPSDTIGFPQVLASIDKDYEGIGIDFLKYVGIHEYGHHLTLNMTQDISEGGVTVGDIHSKQIPTIDGLFNIDLFNKYLAARAPHLRAFNVDQFGEFLTTNDAKMISQLFGFKVCDGVWSQDNTSCQIHNGSSGVITPITLEKISGHRDDNGNIIEPTPTTYSTYGYLGYKKTLTDLKDALPYIAPGLTLAEAVLINSFDNISGTINPTMDFKFISEPATSTYSVKPMNIDLYHSYSDKETHSIKEVVNFDKNLSIQDWLDKYDGVDWQLHELLNLPAIIQLALIFKEHTITPLYIKIKKEELVKAEIEKNYKETHLGVDFDQNEVDKLANEVIWNMNELFKGDGGAESLEKWTEDNIRVIFSFLSEEDLNSDKPGDNNDLKNFRETIYTILIDLKVKIVGLDPSHKMDDNKPDDKLSVEYTILEHALKILGWMPPEVDPGSKNENMTPLFDEQPSITIPTIEHSVYDINDHNWVSIYNDILNLKDKNGNPIFSKNQVQPVDSNTINIDNNDYFYKPITDYVDDPNISNNWLKFSDEFKALTPSEKVVIKSSLNQYFVSLKRITPRWIAQGLHPDSIDPLKKSGDPRPQETNQKMTAYLFSYPEAMTRDFAQITFGYSADEKPLSNGPSGISIYSNQSSFEYYISKELTSQLAMDSGDESTFKNWFTEIASHFALGEIPASKLSAIEIKDLSPEAKEWYDKFTSNDGQNVGLISQDDLINNYFGQTRFLSNGYEKDRKMREILETINGNTWGLYKNEVNKPAFAKPEGEFGATDYWNFIKSIYGIGDRALSGFFREKQSDKVYMYGYISNKDAEQVKWLAFKNTSNGKVSYIPVHKGSEVSNLFYLTTQGDPSSQHTITDDGYTAWATEKFSSGLFVGETISEGSYEVYFVDQNHQKINLFKADTKTPLTFMGNRNYIAENGKIYSTAPTLFQKKDNGSEVYVVNRRFNA